MLAIICQGKNSHQLPKQDKRKGGWKALGAPIFETQKYANASKSQN